MARRNKAVTLAAAAASVVMLSACAAGGGSSGGESDATPLTFWDPYPQYLEGSPWDDLVKSCAPEGTTVELNRGAGDLRPITMGIYNYIGAQNQEYGPMMATAVVASVPMAILLIIAQRYVAAGVTAGAVKD